LLVFFIRGQIQKFFFFFFFFFFFYFYFFSDELMFIKQTKKYNTLQQHTGTLERYPNCNK